MTFDMNLQLQKKDRVGHIDFLRSLSTLYIVGLWHLSGYSSDFALFSNQTTMRLTIMALSMFVFISGYLAGKGICSQTCTGTVDFYKRRLLRIYPLYLIAILLFIVLNIGDKSALVKSIFLISALFGPEPLTLWFVNVIVLYYIILPILAYFANDMRNYVLCVIFILFVFAFMYFATQSFDLRMIIYFPSFAIGAYFSRINLSTLQCRKRWYFIIASVSFLISYGFGEINDCSLSNIFIVLTVTPFVFISSSFHENKLFISPVVQKISYASYAMYLFHRPILSMLVDICSPNSQKMPMVALFFIGLPIVFFFSFSTQCVYDAYIKRKFFCVISRNWSLLNK